MVGSRAGDVKHTTNEDKRASDPMFTPPDDWQRSLSSAASKLSRATLVRHQGRRYPYGVCCLTLAEGPWALCRRWRLAPPGARAQGLPGVGVAPA